MVSEQRNPVLGTGVVLIIVALLLVIAGASTIGDLTAAPRFGLEQLQRPDIGSTSPAETDPPPRLETEPPSVTVSTQVLLALSAALVVIGIALLVRAALLRRREGSEEYDGEGSAGADLPPELSEEELQSLHTYFDDAQAALAQPGRHADAMIRCWLALERAALIAGGGRRPQQTPTEFTTAVLNTFHTDPAGTDVVLRLYQRSRFAVHAEQSAVTDAELGQAQEAVKSMRADIERALRAKVRR